MNTRTTALGSLVFGVDIQSGDVRGDSPSYALVVLDDGEVTRDVVTHRKLRRLIASEEPAMVATDNMYELAADKDALVGFLRSLPDTTRLVQVTGAERPEPLSRVASRHGVPYGKDPMQEAEAAARLAARNVGHEVTAFSDTTEVKVSRGRSTGKGGWSSDRYTRRIHGNVRKEARSLESKFDEAGLDYEQEVTEKYGGYANAVFTVSAPPNEIPASDKRAGDIRVDLSRQRRDGIEFEPLVQRRDRVIVGIDPGTTTAVGVVDLDGGVLETFSSRTADSADVVEWIIERGRPLLIAADVTPMPETVEQFRRSFDAAGWVPASDLPVDEKLHRTRDASYENDHERDALAAALFAFDDHEDQFARITRKTPPAFERGEVIARVLGDESSVEAALRDLRDDEEDDEEESSHEPRELTEEEQRIRRLESQVDRLEDHVDDLKSRLSEKDETIEEYKEELSDARREERREARERREVNRLERENGRLERELESERERAEELESKLERLKALWKLDHSNFADVAGDRDLVPVKVVEQFTRDGVQSAHEEYGISAGDVVYLRDASGAGRSTAELLAEKDPRVVVRDGGISEEADQVLFENDVPVGPADGVTIQEVDELAIAREDEVAALIAEWEDRAEERQKEQKAEMVDQIISEHRADEGRTG